MAITAVQKKAIEEVVSSLKSTKSPTGRGKRLICDMFLELVDREAWPQYYEVIPEPRCMDGVEESLENGRYKEPLDAYMDLSLIFWNGLFYNEPDSQIAIDASILKTVLETEWKKKPCLPHPRSRSPPPGSAQKVHGMAVSQTPVKSKPAAASPAPPATSAVTKTRVSPAANKNAVAGPSKSTPTPSTTIATTSATLAPPTAPAAPNAMRSKLRQFSTDPDANMTVDIDGEGEDYSSQEDGDADVEDELASPSTTRQDVEGARLVKHLEESLPRWPGFGDGGWFGGGDGVDLAVVLHDVKSLKDAIGNRLAVALDDVPEKMEGRELPPEFSVPLSLKHLESRLKSSDSPHTSSPAHFDKDMMTLFLKARRTYPIGSDRYGRVLTLQALYQSSLTSPQITSGTKPTQLTNFAALSAGPGNSRLTSAGGGGNLVPNVTFMAAAAGQEQVVSAVEKVVYKGYTIRVGDWVHLANADDAGRPIVAKVLGFQNGNGDTINVRWYYHAEETFHTPSKKFYSNEVFRTNIIASHPFNDIIEPVHVQLTSQHILGRPRPRSSGWYPGFPLYTCGERYDPVGRAFEQIREGEWDVGGGGVDLGKKRSSEEIYMFERVVNPRKVASPFVRRKRRGKGKVKGNGMGNGNGHGNENGMLSVKGPGGLIRDLGTGTTNPLLLGSGINGTAAAAAAKNATTATGGAQSITQSLGGPSVFTTSGGRSEPLNVDEVVPLFDRHPETGEMFWFSGPPVNVVNLESSLRKGGGGVVRHSREYLVWLAGRVTAKEREREEKELQLVGERESGQGGKRKRVLQGVGVGEAALNGFGHDSNAMDVDGVIPSPAPAEKKRYVYIPPTVGETIRKLEIQMQVGV